MANVEFTSPIKGIHKGLPADKPALNTSEYINNVRAKGFGGRIIITQRPGLDKWGVGTQVGAAEQPVVACCTVAAVA